MHMLFLDSIHHSEDLDRPRPPSVCQRIGCQLYFGDKLSVTIVEFLQNLPNKKGYCSCGFVTGYSFLPEGLNTQSAIRVSGEGAKRLLPKLEFEPAATLRLGRRGKGLLHKLRAEPSFYYSKVPSPLCHTLPPYILS